MNFIKFLMNENNTKLYEDSNWREDFKQYTSNKHYLELLDIGPKKLSEAWLLGALYQKWKKIKGFDKLDPVIKRNQGQLRSSLKDFFNKNNNKRVKN